MRSLEKRLRAQTDMELASVMVYCATSFQRLLPEEGIIKIGATAWMIRNIAKEFERREKVAKRKAMKAEVAP